MHRFTIIVITPDVCLETTVPVARASNMPHILGQASSLRIMTDVPPSPRDTTPSLGADTAPCPGGTRFRAKPEVAAICFPAL